MDAFGGGPGQLGRLVDVVAHGSAPSGWNASLSLPAGHVNPACRQARQSPGQGLRACAGHELAPPAPSCRFRSASFVYLESVPADRRSKTLLKLNGTPPTRVLRAIWLLNELGLEYEHCQVAPRHATAQRPAVPDRTPEAKCPGRVYTAAVRAEPTPI